MIHVGDCLVVMRALDANSVDAIVTDPPYGLGFMGKAWDHGVPGEPFWLEALRVAKPGAWLAAFGGTRTFHRLACAIEDAGWELRDTLMWVYGSGFPKSHNGEWGGTALKPAWEPIVLARKPLIGTVEANWREHGTGALNIDGCRISHAEECRLLPPQTRETRGGIIRQAGRWEEKLELKPEGRWPANLVHDGSDEVVALFPSEAGGSAPASGPTQAGPSKSGSMAGAFNGMGDRAASFHGDTGSAARFFYCAKADRADRNDGCDGLPKRPSLKFDPTSAMAKDGRRGDGVAENNHPTVKPTELMRWLCRLVTPTGGLVLDPFAGSGSTGRGAIAEGFRFVGIELDPDYARIAEARIGAVQPGLALGMG